MALKVTRWWPDTCGCAIEYEWEDTSPEDGRVHTFKNSHAVCPAHALQKGLSTHMTVVYDENQRKNGTIPLLKGAIAALADDQIVWSFNADRQLVITFSGINPSKNLKTAAQTACDARFGAGKVLIQ